MRFTAIITKEEKWYVAHCIELGVVSLVRTIENSPVIYCWENQRKLSQVP